MSKTFAASAPHRLVVCTTCRRDTPAAEGKRDGARFFESIEAQFAALTDKAGVTVTGVECMSGCDRACTLALSAPGKPSFFFGDIEPTTENATQALDLVRLYRDTADGILLRGMRPAAFRRGILARLPPVVLSPPDIAAPPSFGAVFRVRFTELLRWRRDVRHFRPDPLPPGLLDGLLDLADLAPSVGLSQPWRFVSVDDPVRRAAVRQSFETANEDALRDLSGDRAARYAKLKLAGLDEAPCHLAVFSESAPDQGHGLGRRTMPETTIYSTVMAVHTLWLAARAAGLGLGWVSILDPADVTAVLDVPPAWTFIGYFCLGYPQVDSEIPELERLGWERRVPVAANRLRR